VSFSPHNFVRILFIHENAFTFYSAIALYSVKTSYDVTKYWKNKRILFKVFGVCREMCVYHEYSLGIQTIIAIYAPLSVDAP
jgi:hypothetical protein